MVKSAGQCQFSKKFPAQLCHTAEKRGVARRFVRVGTLLLLVCVSGNKTGQPGNSAFICRVYCRDNLPFSFVRGQDSTMWDIVWVSPQGHGHKSVFVSCHFLLQTPQCPCSLRKQFSGDHCCRGRLLDCAGNQVAGLWGHTLGGNWSPGALTKDSKLPESTGRVVVELLRGQIH